MTHSPRTYATIDDKIAFEKTPLDERWTARSVYELLS